jgi:hypothetical protein
LLRQAGRTTTTTAPALAKCKNNGTAFKVGGGYRFGAGLAGEVVLMDFGKSTASDSGIDISLKARAIGGGAALHADLGSGFSGVLRLGLASVKMTVEGSLGGRFPPRASDSSVQPYFGIGVAYAFTPKPAAGGRLGQHTRQVRR